MAALAADRNTPEAMDGLRAGPVAASVTICKGALLVRDASGNVKPGVAETGSVGVGRAEERVDNSAGVAGAATVHFRAGVFRFANAAAADEIAAAEIGDVCYVVDDQTMAKTDDTGSRSPAGIVHDVDPQGVWVRCDEALTRAAAA